MVIQCEIQYLWYRAKKKDCLCFIYVYPDNTTNQEEYNCVCSGKKRTCPDINFLCCNKSFPFSLQCIVHIPLYTLKYISQLASVPLVLLQIFDSYSFLCFSPNSYCSHTTEYKLNLLQTSIALLFLCSLLTSQLVNAMLLWSPWAKKPKRTWMIIKLWGKDVKLTDYQAVN